MPRHISLERGDRGLSDSGARWPEAWPGRLQGAGQNIFPCIRGLPHRSERTDQISQILSELLVGLAQIPDPCLPLEARQVCMAVVGHKIHGSMPINH